MARVLGALLGWLVGSVLRVRRAHVQASMRAAGLPSPGRLARGMYAALGASLVEFFAMAVRPRAVLGRVHVADGSRAAWDAAVGRGAGVVVAASHTGNWDLAACAIAREIELLVVTKRLSIGWIDRLWQGTRARLGVRLCEAAGALVHARETLGRGGAVAMMIDQAPASARHATPATFLGQRAWVDRAPATLAAASGAPLVVAVSRRLPRGRHELVVLDVLEPPRRVNAESGRAGLAWATDATRRATAALDAFVRENPTGWLWMHRRWKPMLRAHHPPEPACPIPSSSPAGASRAA